MYYKLLKNNISKLNPTITSNFLNDKGINVNMDEAILLTNLAKENWETLFNKKYERMEDARRSAKSRSIL